MAYKDVYAKLDIYRELLANRYLLNALLVNLYNLMDIINERDKIIKPKLSKRNKSKLNEIKNKTDVIKFEHFTLTSAEYKALINAYDAEIITDACMILDKYINDTGKSYANPYKKIKEWAVNLAMRERLSDYANQIVLATRKIDYRVIDNKELAMKYIFATPEWKRSIDEGCNYLKDKFNIE